jgi:16S rRNA (guanine(966)-N(2))-methyltransferase RsmD
MDRMREALFSILGDIRGSAFLDLYCGSGSVGIEAASRGAEPVVFVEKDRGKRGVLQRNLSFLREQTELHLLPVEHYLRRVNRRFDLIFLDPPFRQRGKLDVLRMVAVRGILAEGGTLIIHLSKEEEKGFPTEIGMKKEAVAAGDDTNTAGSHLHLTDKRSYGGSLVLFFSETR